MNLSLLDKKIIRELQNTIPIEPRPFSTIARRIGISESELIRRIQYYKENIFIRRFGAVINHRQIGLTANPMIVWSVPDIIVDDVGQKIASYPQVTHCYLRPRLPDFPYNLFSMIHTQTVEASVKIAADISTAVDIKNYKLLFSAEELKKTSMKYFCE